MAAILTIFTVVDLTLYFSATVVGSGNELWKTNGTSSGTVMVRDISEGPQSSYPSLMIDVAGTLYFIADDGINGSEFWKSDGTSSGTSIAFELAPGAEPTFGDYPYYEDYGYHNFAEATANGKLYFGYRNELYESNGTMEGTKSLGKINAGYYYYSPRLYEIRGTIYVLAMDEGNCCNYGHTWHLARVENSSLVTIKPLPQSENINLQLIDTSIGIFFPFADSQRNFRLWISDGTADGTYPFHDSQSFTLSSTPRGMVVVDDHITFYADDHIEYVVTRLWRSDGTLQGTYRISDSPVDPMVSSSNEKFTASETSSWISRIPATLRLPADSGNIHLLGLYKGATYFSVTDPIKSYAELWKTDGTNQGTERITVLSHEYGGGAHDGTVFNDILYFSGTPQNIWRTDGTAKGTFLLSYAGSEALTLADEFTATASTLFFRAYAPSVGFELFKLGAEDAPVTHNRVNSTQVGSGIINEGETRLQCYPNPFANTIAFSMHTAEAQSMTISLRGLDGKTVLRMDELVTNQTYSIGQGLRPGLYLFYVQVGNRMYVQRVMKVN
jgi:ELWxxDGT repeat protein